MAEEKENYHKPSFDGRLKYYDHLKMYWDTLALHSFNMDIPAWYKTLRGYFSRTKAYVEPTKATSIMAKFQLISNNINSLTFNPPASKQHKSMIEMSITSSLQTIEDELFTATKDMLIPTKTEEDDDFDMDKFMEASDL